MFDKRALKIEIIKKPDATEEPRAVVYIYADDDCSPVAQVWAVPLSRISITKKDSYDAIYCQEEWGLANLLKDKL